MTPIDTAELERLAAEITPGEWRHFMGDICADLQGDDTVICGMNKSYGARSSDYYSYKATNPTAQANARAIALLPALLHEVLARRKAEAWQPIETAPHETLVVLGWYEGDVWKQEIALASAGTRYPNGYSDRWQHGRASHWRPLPAPPTTPEAEGGSDA